MPFSWTTSPLRELAWPAASSVIYVAASLSLRRAQIQLSGAALKRLTVAHNCVLSAGSAVMFCGLLVEITRRAASEGGMFLLCANPDTETPTGGMYFWSYCYCARPPRSALRATLVTPRRASHRLIQVLRASGYATPALSRQSAAELLFPGAQISDFALTVLLITVVAAIRSTTTRSYSSWRGAGSNTRSRSGRLGCCSTRPCMW